MTLETECPLAAILAERMRGSRDALVERWLHRIADRVDIDPNRIFPSDELIDHVPILIDGIADYLEDPADEISADVPVLEKALELGKMRHSQGFDLYEILKEYEILGGILHHFVQTAVGDIDEPCTREELVACTHRLFRAIALIQQVTATEYMRREQERVSDREQRLRGFNRALSHEIRSRIGAVQNAVEMLGEDFVLDDAVQRETFRAIARENSREMIRVIENLIELSRPELEARRHRHVLLPDAAAEAVRQLRNFAAVRSVDVRLGELPRIEVPASLLELALSNFLSNAIKYHDPHKPERWVRVEGSLAAGELTVVVTDNGIGVPEAQRERLFQRFFRAAEENEAVGGTGLGLSIVRDAIEALGGRVWADFEQPGETRFGLAVPGRREADR